MLVLSLGAQGLVLAEVFFFAVLHSGALLPVCALIRLVSSCTSFCFRYSQFLDRLCVYSMQKNLNFAFSISHVISGLSF